MHRIRIAEVQSIAVPLCSWPAPELQVALKVAAAPDAPCCRGCVANDIVDWVRQQAASLPRVPSLAFVHIPIPQFSEAWSSGAPANGTKGEDTGCPLADSGLFAMAK